jgi:hypothetical protein
MELTDPATPKRLSDVGEMISFHSAREKNGSRLNRVENKRKREEGEQAEAAPRACKGQNPLIFFDIKLYQAHK